MTQGTGYNPSERPNNLATLPGPVSAGVVYGTQAKETWDVGAVDVRQMLDLQRAPHLWKISVFGENVLVSIRYGTLATKVIENLQPPVLMTVPGQCEVRATPVGNTPSGAHCEVTATQSSSSKQAAARRLVSGAQAFPPDATRFFATGASTVALPSGPAVVLAPLQEIPLVAGSSLTAGDGYLEFDT